MKIQIKCQGAISLPYNEILPLQGNLKELSVENKLKLKKSILELGFSEPCSVWRNPTDNKWYSINSHQRIRAITELVAEGATCPDLPCSIIQADSLKEAKKKVLSLTSQFGEITDEGLNQFLKESDISFSEVVESFRFPEINFDKFEINFMKDEAKELIEDDVPAIPATPRIKLGDLVELGNHRLICGDSTDPATVSKLTNGVSMDLMYTDPPYGVKLDNSWRDGAKQGQSFGSGNSNTILNDDRFDWTDSYKLFNGDIAYVWHPSKFIAEFKSSIESCDLICTQMIVWNKSVMVMGRSDYHWKHEPCWYAIRKGKTHRWAGDRTQTTIWDAASPNHIMGNSEDDKTEHPSQKPICLATKAIGNHLVDNVYDPFLGSGTTLIACEKLNKKCFGIDLDPKYCDMIVTRFCNYSGQNKIKINGVETEWGLPTPPPT